jgi:hypothetical protein
VKIRLEILLHYNRLCRGIASCHFPVSSPSGTLHKRLEELDVPFYGVHIEEGWSALQVCLRGGAENNYP